MSTCAPSASTSSSGSTSAADAGETIVARLLRLAERPERADFLHLLHDGRPPRRIGYRELLWRAADWADELRERGLRRGDPAVLLLPHGEPLYAAFVGALLGEFVPTICAPPSPKVSAEDYAGVVAGIIENARPRALITSHALTARLSPRLARRGLVEVYAESVARAGDGGGTGDWQAGHATDRLRRRLGDAALFRPDQTAFLQYSSGTTGAKKGVAISHRALLWQIDVYAAAIDLRDDDTIASWLPLYHDMGLIACLMLPLLTRTRLVAMCPFEWVRRPRMWFEAVTQHRATLCWLPNFAYNFLAAQIRPGDERSFDLSSLRGVVNCSEPILAASHEKLLAAAGPLGLRPEALAASYAMAENTFAVTSGGFGRPLVEDVIDPAAFRRSRIAHPATRGDAGALRLASSGRPLPQTLVRIVDEAGRELPQRHVGQIVIQSPCLLSGYHRNAAETAAALRDGWYFTGDLGYLADGELYVTGRARDLIIIRGHNIYPQDVEAVAMSVPGVIAGRCVAFGVDDTSGGTQQLVIIAETHEQGAAPRAALREAIRERVTHALEVAPADVVIVDHMWLRKSTSGKPSRAINRERYLADRGGHPCESATLPQRFAPAATPSILQTPTHAAVAANIDLPSVAACVRRVLSAARPERNGELKPDEPLISSGLIDSLNLVTLIETLERDFQVHIPAAELADPAALDTVQSIASLLRRCGPAAQRIASGALETAGPAAPAAVEMFSGRRVVLRRSTGFWTALYRLIFRWHGVRVGRGLRVCGPLILRFDGDARNIEIGDNVTLMPWVDLKVRERGRIILHDGVVLDTMARLVAANDARIEVGQHAQVAMGTIINAGADVLIGARTAIAGFCTIVASEHRYRQRTPVMQQGYVHEPVSIGQDVWLAANVFVGRGSRIGDGAVIGAKSAVRGTIPPYSIVTGNPGRVVGFRS